MPANFFPAHAGELFLPALAKLLLPTSTNEFFFLHWRRSSSPRRQASPPHMLASSFSPHRNGELFLPNASQAPPPHNGGLPPLHRQWQDDATGDAIRMGDDV
ncbi:Os02g0493075 [Oryza sativa Japonica Group]|nr:Os02g0493075 [Oryza sativa Japonica Group]